MTPITLLGAGGSKSRRRNVPTELVDGIHSSCLFLAEFDSLLVMVLNRFIRQGLIHFVRFLRICDLMEVEVYGRYLRPIGLCDLHFAFRRRGRWWNQAHLLLSLLHLAADMHLLP